VISAMSPQPLPLLGGPSEAASTETERPGATGAVSRRYSHCEEALAVFRAPVERIFARLDDHARLSAHMSRPSWRMGWSRMAFAPDHQGGRVVGSHLFFFPPPPPPRRGGRCGRPWGRHGCS
jgi:hypothetical protein